MLVTVWVSDDVEEAVASWFDPLVHVMVRSFRLEEHERRILDPSTGDVVSLGLSVGGFNTKELDIELELTVAFVVIRYILACTICRYICSLLT